MNKQKQTRKRWTEEEHEIMRQLYPTTPARVLAERFGVTPHAIRQKASQLELRSKQPPKQVYELYQGETLMASGTVDEIAEQTGIKPSRLYVYASPSYLGRTTDGARRLVKLENNESKEAE